MVYARSKSERPRARSSYSSWITLASLRVALLCHSGAEMVSFSRLARSTVRFKVYRCSPSANLNGTGCGGDVPIAKRTRVWAVTSLVTLFVGLSMTWLLVPRIGPAGAALGWIMGTLLATIMTYHVSRQVSGITLPIGRSLVVVLAAALIGTCATWQHWSLPVRLLVLAGGSAACWAGMGVRLRELRTLR